MQDKCFLCGQNNPFDPLETHHIFGGAMRAKSERYGLKVRLCGQRCHRLGHKAAHQNADTMLILHRYGQRKARDENGWTSDDFIREFHKNYL